MLRVEKQIASKTQAQLKQKDSELKQVRQDYIDMEQKLREQMYQVYFLRSYQLLNGYLQAHGFDEYISEYLVSLNRSLPDRREAW